MLRNWKPVWKTYSLLKFSSVCVRSCSKNFTRQYGLVQQKSKQTSRFKSHSLHGNNFDFHQPNNLNRLLQLEVMKHYSTSNDGSNVKPDWTVHELFMTTCIDVWEDYPAGANVIVGYIDTASQLTRIQKKQMPLILALAEIDQSDSLKPLLEPLANSGFRVVMPFFMGSKYTRGVTKLDGEYFSHMLEERTVFLMDFIGSMNIDRIDTAIGHSLECFPLLALSSYCRIVDSLVFICSVPGHEHPRWISPLNVSFRMLSWFNKFLRWPIAALWYQTYVRHRISSIRRLSMAELHTYAALAHGVNYDVVPGLGTMLESKRTPIVYAFCDHDPMVDCKLSTEYADILGVSPELTESYDEAGLLVEKASGLTDRRYTKGLKFSSKSHFPHMQEQFRDIILKEIFELHKNALGKNKSIEP